MLAFSTVSQIGYMVLAVGSGAYVAAIFLMVMHAFFKGLLFLGAGSVIHGLEDEQDLKRMGALRRYMKWTTVTFTVGFLAIAGIPPLSGFWAKGDVLDNVFAHSMVLYKVLWAIGLLTAVLTAYYMSRLEVLAFGGEPRFDKVGPQGQPALHEPHESPWVMRVPLVVLAFFAFFGGVLNLPWVHTHDLESWLAPVFSGTLYNNTLSDASQWALAVTDIAAALIGVIVAYNLWRGAQVDKPALEPAFLQRVWYWDDFYDTIIGRPSQRIADVLRLGGGRADHRRCGQRRGAPGQGRRHGGPAAADGLRPELRAGHRHRPGSPGRLHVEQDVVGMTHIVPYLTLLVLVPAIGAAVLGLLGLDRRLPARCRTRSRSSPRS